MDAIELTNNLAEEEMQESHMSMSSRRRTQERTPEATAWVATMAVKPVVLDSHFSLGQSISFLAAVVPHLSSERPVVQILVHFSQVHFRFYPLVLNHLYVPQPIKSGLVKESGVKSEDDSTSNP